MASPESSQSLLEWLATRYPDTPRKRLKDWFHIGRVRLDGRTVVRFQDIVEDPGERLVLAERASGLGPVSSGIRLHQLLRLAHLDGGIAVVNKSPGLLSVPAPQRQEPSALDLLRKHLERSKARQEEPFPVHRLDEYTSGLLCFALTREAREHLIEQVRSHRLERT